MKIDLWGCFFTKTKEPDGKIPEYIKTMQLKKELSKLSVHKIAKKNNYCYPSTPYVSSEDLQFHLELDDDRYAPKKV